MGYLVYLPYALGVLKDPYLVGIMNIIIDILNVVVENMVVINPHRHSKLVPDVLLNLLTTVFRKYLITIRFQTFYLRKVLELVHGQILRLA